MEDSRRELRPPAPLALLGEVRIAPEVAGVLMMYRRLVRSAPRGSGATVLVVPGFATDDRWTALLRRFLGDIGHRPVGWGLGRNHGRVDQLLPALRERVTACTDDTGGPIRMVGWSLGGYLAREVARELPTTVEQVVTLGAPVRGGPKYTASASAYRRRGVDLDKIENRVASRERTPIEVPVAAVYSRSDGVVAWRACVDDRNPHVEHHVVRSSHLGLIASPQVYRLIAELMCDVSAPRRGRDAT